MNEEEVDTTATMPTDKFEASENTFQPEEKTDSESDFEEIDFPKLRTVRVLNDKTIIELTVNFQKIEEQMKYFTFNKSISE